MRKNYTVYFYLLFFSLGFASRLLAVINVGSGFSTVTDGRQIPALNIGVRIQERYLLSAMTTGVATKAYYHSAYNLNLFYWQQAGSRWFGRIYSGIGAGILYEEKALLESRAHDKMIKSKAMMIGPAFRVAVYPIDSMFVALEFTMGLDVAAFGGGWGDMGMLAIGFQL